MKSLASRCSSVAVRLKCSDINTCTYHYLLYPTSQSILRYWVVWFAVCYEKLGAFFIHKSCPKVQIFFNASYRTEKFVFGICTENNWFIRSWVLWTFCETCNVTYYLSPTSEMSIFEVSNLCKVCSRVPASIDNSIAVFKVTCRRVRSSFLPRHLKYSSTLLISHIFE